jgi:DNA polymerase-4
MHQLDSPSPVRAAPPTGRLLFDPAAPEVENPRTILHVDLDCFFVSVERVLNPSLGQRPVIVGGAAEERGVVTSASREARATGVHAGMPTAIARRLCPEATFLPGRGRMYARASAAAFKVLGELAARVERASIDEAWLDVTDELLRWHSAFDLAAALQGALHDRLGLPSSAGIAANKLVAKVACTRAKPEGILEVWPGYEGAFLAPLPVGDLPGVGPVLAKKLELFGLATVGQLARVNPALMESTFGRLGRSLARAARGQGDDDVDQRDGPRSIGCERTLVRDVSSTARLIEELYSLAREVAHRLRRRGLAGRTVTLKLKSADFQLFTRSRTLRDPTDLESEIAGVACFLLRELQAEPRPVRLIGVTVSRFEDEPAQASLFPRVPDLAGPAGPSGQAAAPELAPSRRWIDWAALLPGRLLQARPRA